MEPLFIKLQEFHKVLQAHLLASNQMFEKMYAQGNISLVLDGLEFSMPCRDILIGGKKVRVLLLEGEMESTDKVIGVIIK